MGPCVSQRTSLGPSDPILPTPSALVGGTRVTPVPGSNFSHHGHPHRPNPH